MLKNVSNKFSYYVTNFLSSYLINQKGLSINTIKSYRDTFKSLLIFFIERKNLKISKISLDDFNKDTIIEFLDYIEQEKGNSINTRNQRLSAIHSFFKYLQFEDPTYIHKSQKILDISFKKKQQKVIEYLTPEAVKILLKQPNINDRNGLRDLLILTLLYDTGARVQELIDIKVKDIRIDEPSIIVLHGKGNKDRQVPIMSNTKIILNRYIEKYKKQPHQYLFESSQDKKFSRKGICYIINKYANIAKKEINIFPKNIHPHIFRHTKAMHLLQSNVNLIYIRDFLGHTDIQTTEIYAKYDAETKRKAIENAYPNIINNDLSNWQKDNDLMKWLNNL